MGYLEKYVGKITVDKLSFPIHECYYPRDWHDQETWDSMTDQEQQGEMNDYFFGNLDRQLTLTIETKDE
jgi:hypothetical protein